MVAGVSKTSHNNGKGRSRKTKSNVRVLYFYDEGGNFHTKRVSFFKGLYYKQMIQKLKTCKNCKSRYIGSCDCGKA